MTCLCLMHSVLTQTHTWYTLARVHACAPRSAYVHTHNHAHTDEKCYWPQCWQSKQRGRISLESYTRQPSLSISSLSLLPSTPFPPSLSSLTSVLLPPLPVEQKSSPFQHFHGKPSHALGSLASNSPTCTRSSVDVRKTSPLLTPPLLITPLFFLFICLFFYSAWLTTSVNFPCYISEALSCYSKLAGTKNCSLSSFLNCSLPPPPSTVSFVSSSLWVVFDVQSLQFLLIHSSTSSNKWLLCSDDRMNNHDCLSLGCRSNLGMTLNQSLAFTHMLTHTLA